MFKSLISHKQVFVYIIILLAGFELGIWFTESRRTNTTSTSSIAQLGPDGKPLENCRDPASLTNEPELLGSPEFLDAGVLKSQVQGWIHVRWKAVNGAKSYNVRVWDKAGVEVKNFQTHRTFSFLKNLDVDPRLKETPYSVVVTPIGDGEVQGKPSQKKMAAMLPLRNLEPPTIKSIQTEAEGEPMEETPKTEI